MNIHLIAIGGSAMHNLALELHKKGYQVTGSDDEIFEPSKSRLEAAGLLPEKWGWYPERITSRLDAVILGMHAREDNPELQKAQELGIPIYSYPEYLYKQQITGHRRRKSWKNDHNFDDHACFENMRNRIRLYGRSFIGRLRYHGSPERPK